MISVQCLDQVQDDWAGIRRRGKREVSDHPVPADDHVRTELVDVLGRAPQPSTAAEQSSVRFQRTGGPHLPASAPIGAEQSIEPPVGVREDHERQFEVIAIRAESSRVGEGDEGDDGVTELVDLIAHGDHVRKSS
jgi:hypothetical protein